MDIKQELKNLNTRVSTNLRKGSTGEAGKLFEIEERIGYKLDNHAKLYRNDFRAHSANSYDMAVIVDGKKRFVELKTGCGALIYENDETTAWEKLEKLTRSERLFVWRWDAGQPPICMVFKDFFKVLDTYQGRGKAQGLKTWLRFVPPATTNARGGQIQFQSYKNSSLKLAFLEKIAYEYSLDWETVKQNGVLE